MRKKNKNKKEEEKIIHKHELPKKFFASRKLSRQVSQYKLEVTGKKKKGKNKKEEEKDRKGRDGN